MIILNKVNLELFKGAVELLLAELDEYRKEECGSPWIDMDDSNDDLNVFLSKSVKEFGKVRHKNKLYYLLDSGLKSGVSSDDKVISHLHYVTFRGLMQCIFEVHEDLSDMDKSDKDAVNEAKSRLGSVIKAVYDGINVPLLDPEDGILFSIGNREVMTLISKDRTLAAYRCIKEKERRD